MMINFGVLVSAIRRGKEIKGTVIDRDRFKSTKGKEVQYKIKCKNGEVWRMESEIKKKARKE